MGLPFLSATEVRQRCSPLTAVELLEATLLDGFDPESDPPRTIVRAQNGQLLVMPSSVRGGLAVKLVTVGGTPRIQGVCVTFDRDTLAPVAVIDATALTLLRTAAVSALAVRHLAVEDAARLVVFGRGPQAHAHVESLREVRPIRRVHMLGRDDPDADRLVAQADVVCCCTTSREPLFDGGLVPDHASVVAIGSHDPGARETDDELCQRAMVVVESRASALREAGDIIAPVESGHLLPEDLVPLADLVRGKVAPGPKPRFFKSTGMSWEDTVIASALAAPT